MTPDEYFNQYDIQIKSREDAQKELIKLKPIIIEIVNSFQRFKQTYDELSKVSNENGSVQEIQMKRFKLDQHEARLSKLKEKLDSNDVILRDWESGIIDFPSQIDGRPIWYCFEPDENDISYFHEIGLSCDWRKSINIM